MRRYRQIFFDGRKLPDDMLPTRNGYSVAHREGDTLRVEENAMRCRLSLALSAVSSFVRV
jgi:hypothetical protein